MYTVFGAGSVGTVLAGLLADARVPVAIAGRGAVGRLRLEGDDETVEARVPVVAEPEGTILLCVHGPDVSDLCPRWPGRTVVTFQNGVRAEALAARWCRVIGGVWRMTCTLVEPGRALFTRRGRVVVGRHPEGIDPEVESLAADLRRAGFDVGVSPRIGRDKWLKLFLNLASTAHALVRREDHGRPEFGRLKAAILEEAREVFARAGIVAVSCDGRDASLDEEIERHRRGGGRARPVHNSTWRQLSLGRRPKERFHDTVLSLGPAPRNAAMLALLDRATSPECYTVDEALTAVCGR
jgi:ketopantoate reductase